MHADAVFEIFSIVAAARTLKNSVEGQILRRIELRAKAVGNPGTVERIGQLAGNAGCRRHGRINVSKELMVDGHRGIDRCPLRHFSACSEADAPGQRLEVVLAYGNAVGARVILAEDIAVGHFHLGFDVEPKLPETSSGRS